MSHGFPLTLSAPPIDGGKTDPPSGVLGCVWVFGVLGCFHDVRGLLVLAGFVRFSAATYIYVCIYAYIYRAASGTPLQRIFSSHGLAVRKILLSLQFWKFSGRGREVHRKFIRDE